ncbi:hypothetical protein ACFSCZ_06695 [Siminovitchia sediminis]|uniref:DUF2306 domain-containing protein n=1 Tax=Siminovitchia sediminis TaxID=1274353 RepID=A0ABW4KE00_9BACI
MFKGEKGLVMTGLLGFLLAAVVGLFILVRGPVVLPEGNLGNAFSFNAAIGIFTLSIAAVLPLAGFSIKRRKAVRWLFMNAVLHAYAIETIQHFRGFNPRFSREGSVIDMIAGMIFGIQSLLIVTLCFILMFKFFKVSASPLILGVRYAFISVFAANLAGVAMIVLQSRFLGNDGNFIVLHGMGFHALQTLVLSGWLLEKVHGRDRLKKRLIHSGSIAWIASIILIGVQTVLGRTVFEFTLLPILAVSLIVIWLVTVWVAVTLFKKAEGDPQAKNTKVLEKPITDQTMIIK